MKRKPILFAAGAAALAAVALAPIDCGTSVVDQRPIHARVSSASHAEKANIKSCEIRKVLTPRVVERSQYDIEIVDVQAIDGGVEILARAWHNGQQIGFGEDGSVDIERFRIFNPPILVPDKAGEIVQDIFDVQTGAKSGERRLKEDPQEAMIQVIEHNLSVMKNVHVGSRTIEKDKVGRTTSTFYPAAGTNSPVDGWTGTDVVAGESWANIRARAGGRHNDTGATSVFVGQRKSATTTWEEIFRSFFGFNTASIGDGDTISSATFSVKVASVTSGFGAVLAVDSKAPANTADLANSDHNVSGWTDTKHSNTTYADTAIAANDWLDFSLNATGLSAVSKTGLSWFGGRLDADITNTEVTTFDSHSTKTIDVYAADQAGTTDDPKLVVEHTAPVESTVDDLIIFE